MATTVIADRPTPVSSRVTNNPVTSQANALQSEKTEYHTVVAISARLRPMRSEIHPAVDAPTNMPMNDADVMLLIDASDRCQAWRIAGAAKAKLLRSPSSKKKMYPRSLTRRRWNSVIGGRSSRSDAADAPGLTASTSIARVRTGRGLRLDTGR